MKTSVIFLALVILFAGCQKEQPAAPKQPSSGIEDTLNSLKGLADDRAKEVQIVNQEEAIVATVSDTSFEKTVLRNPLPVMVDFFATWCEPCKAMKPVYDATAAAYAGQVVFAAADVDKLPATVSKYGINAMPTIVLFKGGKEVSRVVGGQSAAELKALADGLRK